MTTEKNLALAAVSRANPGASPGPGLSPIEFAATEPGLQWQKLQGMAMHDDANWDQEVCRRTCMTLMEAKAFAAADDRITFFFYVKHFAIMSRHQVLHAGDVVFFCGVPTLRAEDGADIYEKPAARENLVSIAAAHGNNWISIQARLQVPACGGDKALSYLWPGLQPGGRHRQAIRGGLQPVLRYCPPQNGRDSATAQHVTEAGWWICGQYLATDKPGQAPHNCFGGPRMAVMPGDILCSSLVYDAAAKTWMLTIQNVATRLSVLFPISLKQHLGQVQERNTAYFCLENLGRQATDPAHLGQCLSLFNVVAKVAHPQADLGRDLHGLPHVEHISLSDDQTSLHVSRMVLYSPGWHAI